MSDQKYRCDVCGEVREVSEQVDEQVQLVCVVRPRADIEIALNLKQKTCEFKNVS